MENCEAEIFSFYFVMKAWRINAAGRVLAFDICVFNESLHDFGTSVLVCFGAMLDLVLRNLVGATGSSGDTAGI
jgi:hypothetical protein